MSSDCKAELLKSISVSLVNIVDAETAALITDVITIRMHDYEVERRTTALSTEVRQTDDQLIKNYLACIAIEGKSQGTLKQYRRSIYKLLDYAGRSCLEIRTTDIRAWLASMKVRGLKSVTVSNQLSNAASFFHWLSSEKIRPDDPCIGVGSIKVPREEKKAFTSEDIDTIRSLCDDTYKRAVVETLLSSGVRINELCNLELKDIDFDQLTVKVRAGKGGKDRTTFITPVCRKHLLAYLSGKKHPSSFVFSKDYDGTGYSTNGVGKMLRKIGEESGIHVHPHRFRRTLATDLARKGMPIQEIQIILGHANIATTRGYIDTELSQVQASYRQLVA